MHSLPFSEELHSVFHYFAHLPMCHSSYVKQGLDKVRVTNNTTPLEIGKLVIGSEMYKRKSFGISSGYENIFMLE